MHSLRFQPSVCHRTNVRYARCPCPVTLTSRRLTTRRQFKADSAEAGAKVAVEEAGPAKFSHGYLIYNPVAGQENPVSPDKHLPGWHSQVCFERNKDALIDWMESARCASNAVHLHIDCICPARHRHHHHPPPRLPSLAMLPSSSAPA